MSTNAAAIVMYNGFNFNILLVFYLNWRSLTLHIQKPTYEYKLTIVATRELHANN